MQVNFQRVQMMYYIDDYWFFRLCLFPSILKENEILENGSVSFLGWKGNDAPTSVTRPEINTVQYTDLSRCLSRVHLRTETDQFPKWCALIEFLAMDKVQISVIWKYNIVVVIIIIHMKSFPHSPILELSQIYWSALVGVQKLYI
jgi:hypothetical protein